MQEEHPDNNKILGCMKNTLLERSKHCQECHDMNSETKGKRFHCFTSSFFLLNCFTAQGRVDNFSSFTKFTMKLNNCLTV